MDRKKIIKSEFQVALEALNSCSATLNCGCQLSSDDSFWLEGLLRAADEFSHKNHGRCF